MSREAMQQALRLIEDEGHKADLLEAASILRAALAEQKCPCGDRPANQCPGEWEPGCDLGANEKHAKVATADASLGAAIEAIDAALAEQAQPVAWMIWLHGPVEIIEHKQFAELELERLDKMYPNPARKLLPLYTAPPAPQPCIAPACQCRYEDTPNGRIWWCQPTGAR